MGCGDEGRRSFLTREFRLVVRTFVCSSLTGRLTGVYNLHNNRITHVAMPDGCANTHPTSNPQPAETGHGLRKSVSNPT